MLIPINTDAPIYYFPFATIGLIVVNVFCFLLTRMGSIEAVEVCTRKRDRARGVGGTPREHGRQSHRLNARLGGEAFDHRPIVVSGHSGRPRAGQRHQLGAEHPFGAYSEGRVLEQIEGASQ